MANPALDYSRLPAFGLPSPDDEKKDQPGPITAGLIAGLRGDLQGGLGSAVEGAGKLFGVAPLENAGRAIVDNGAAVAQSERPDLDGSLFQSGGPGFMPRLEYQLARQLPTLAAFVAGGKGLAKAGIEAPSGLQRLGAVVPRVLGGGGLTAGADFAARRVALDVGKQFGQTALGAEAVGIPLSFGSMFQQAQSKPGGATVADAEKAAVLAPFHAALYAAEPAQLTGLLSRGLAGNIAARVVSASLTGAAAQVVRGGVQSALEQSFRPDLSTSQKFANIVDAAVSGGAIGAVFGGLGGVRALKHVDPKTVTTDDLASTIDQQLSLPAPQAFTDSAGRTVVGARGGDELRATPREQPGPAPVDDITSQGPAALVSPEAAGGRSAIDGSTIVVGRRSDQGRFTNEATGVEQPPVVPEDTSRAFRNFTDGELTSARNALANKQEAGGLTDHQKQIATAIDTELQFRNDSSTKKVIPDEASRSGAAQAEPTAGDGGTDSAAPAPTNTTDLSDLLTGISTRKRYADVQSRDDLAAAVRTRLEQGSAAQGDLKLAERLGIDTNAPAAPPVEATPARPADKAAATSVAQPDDTFALQFKQDVQKLGQKDPGARSIKPVDEADAQRQLYQALGRDTEIGDGLERLAQKYGVLDDEKKLTPLAVEIAKKEPITTETAVKAAMAQGYKGADASMFDRGVQSYVAGEKPTEFDNTAYMAGAKWAEEHNSVPSGALKKYEPTPAHTVTDEQRALGQNIEVKRATIPPEAHQQQLVNEAIDNSGITPAAHEGDIAQLKTMVRNGDIEGAMKGLQRVQGGESLFEQSERQQGTFKGETVTRGAPRGQATPEMVPTKATSRAQAEQAIRKFELSRAIKSAHNEGSIDRRTMIGLIAKLQQGRVAEVASALPDGSIKSTVVDAATLRAEAERRQLVAAHLEQVMNDAQREAEVPELQVDENGVLRSPYRIADGMLKTSLADRANAARVVNAALVHPDPKSLMQSIIALGGELGAMAKRFERVTPDFNVRVMLPDEMDALTKSFGSENGAYGMFDHGNNTLYLDASIPHPSIALHEVVHAIVDKHIAAGTPIGKEMISIFNRFKKLGPQDDYAFNTNAHEFMAEFLSREQVRDYVRSFGDGKGSVFQRAWDVIRKALGMPQRDFVERLLNLAEAAGDNQLGPDGNPLRSAYKINKGVESTVKNVASTFDEKLNEDAIRGKVRRGSLYGAAESVIAEYWGKWFDTPLGDGAVNGVKGRVAAMDSKHAMASRQAQPVTEVQDRINKLERDDKPSHVAINRLMQLTEHGLNPLRSWEQQSKVVTESKNADALKAVWQDSQPLVRSLKAKGTLQLYHDLRALNDVSILSERATRLHQLVQGDKIAAGRIPEFAVAPMDKFMEHAASAEMNLDATHSFWRDEINTQLSALDAFLGNQRRAADGLPSGQRSDMLGRVEEIESHASELRGLLKTLDEVPYFHLGRNGDYFVNMRLRRLDDGKTVDPDALAAAAEHLKDFGRVISPSSDRSNVFIRVDNEVAQRNLMKAAAELQKRNIVTGDRDDGKGNVEFGIRAGKRSDDSIRNGLASDWLNGFISRINADESLSAADRRRMVDTARNAALDLMPDNSLALVMTRRQNVPGYEPNMYQSFFDRQKIGIDAHVGLAVAPKITQAYSHMRLAIQRAQGADESSVPINQRNGMTDVLNEVARRDQERANEPRTPVLDAMRRASNTWALGASPSFVVVQLAQPFQLVLPKLGSRYGFVKAAQAMGRVTPLAFKIMRQVFKDGWDVNPSRSFDAVINLGSLQRAGASKSVAEYLMHIANTGQLDIGGPVHELIRAVDGSENSNLGKVQRFASAPGYYAETFTRVLTALAHREFNGDVAPREAAQSAAQLLKDTMWNYAQDAQGRAFGKSGFLGKYTPLSVQFMTYTSQLVQRLYLEMHDAMRGETAQSRSEARKFLMGHAAATTMLAGTLGLPFATALAAAYDKLKDLVDGGDGPSDIRTSYRNWLADVFGPDVGEMIARGLPRAGGAGVDLSQRVGEQDIAPFSRFIADRRGFKDSLKDLESRTWGAPASQAYNFLQGSEQVLGGNVLAGMTQMMPNSMAAMLKSYQMTDKGYTDAAGNQLPIAPPSASATLMQLLGFTPAPKAEYTEANNAQTTRKAILTREKVQLGDAIAKAVIGGDHDQARELIRQAVNFDKANPAFAVIPGIEGSVERRMKQQAISAATRTPLRVNPKDKTGREFTRYANIEFAPQ